MHRDLAGYGALGALAAELQAARTDGGDPADDGGGADGLTRLRCVEASRSRVDAMNILFLAQSFGPLALILWMLLALPSAKVRGRLMPA